MNSSSFSSDPGVWFACLSPSKEQIMQQRIQEPMSWDDVAQSTRMTTTKSRTASVTSSYDSEFGHLQDDMDYHPSFQRQDNEDHHHHHHIVTQDVQFEDDMLRCVDQLLDGENDEDFNMFDFDPQPMNNHSHNNKRRSSTKKVMCKFYLNGTCKAGDKCRFSHGEQPQISSPLTTPTRLRRTSSASSVGSNHSSGGKYCKFYEQGYCRNSACTFIHDPSRVNYEMSGSAGSNRSSFSFSPQMSYMDTYASNMQASAVTYQSPVQDRPYQFSPQHMYNTTTTTSDFSPGASPSYRSPQTYPNFGDEYHTEYSPTNYNQSDDNADCSDSDNKVCPFYLKGECRYGERCRNLHIRLSTNKKKLDNASLERMSKIPCKYFRQGVCPFGSMCYFSHEIVDNEDDEFNNNNNIAGTPEKVIYESEDQEAKATESS